MILKDDKKQKRESLVLDRSREVVVSARNIHGSPSRMPSGIVVQTGPSQAPKTNPPTKEVE